MNNRFQFFVIFLVPILVMSCSQNDRGPFDFYENYPYISNWNTQMEINIVYPEYLIENSWIQKTDYRIGDAVELEVFNHGNVYIQVIPDKDIQIYQIDKGNLIRITNNTNYSAVINFIPSIEKDFFGEGVMFSSVRPGVKVSKESVVVRIVVIGTLCDDLDSITNEHVGAFIDVTLLP